MDSSERGEGYAERVRWAKTTYDLLVDVAQLLRVAHAELAAEFPLNGIEACWRGEMALVS